MFPKHESAAVQSWLFKQLEPQSKHASQGGGMGYQKAKDKFIQDAEAESRNKDWANMTQEEREADREEWNRINELKNGL